MDNLAEVLSHYGIKGKVEKINQGPLIKQIEFLPATGTKISAVTASLPDIARELGVKSLRVEPVANSNNLGFEIPADSMQTIDFEKILNSPDLKNAKGDLPICLGVDIKGTPVFADLAAMPHLLIAGTTGSGKSVGLNTFILSLIKRKTPDELKFVLIDPKRIEFSTYNNQQYMLMPVVTDTALASESLNYLVQEMERRYSLFEQNLCKNIGDYKAKVGPMPYIVCVIDEFADLIASDKKVEKSIQLLAQKARACGIHIMLATQRPSVDVVTGVLKANFPTRLSYKVASQTDSRTILDMAGAEDLIGRGDSLFLASNGTLKRVHGAYMPDDAIEKMLKPYRCTIKPLDLSATPAQAAPAKTTAAAAPKAKEGQSWFMTLFKDWGNLRQKDKKTIISAITWAFGLLIASGAGKKRR